MTHINEYMKHVVDELHPGRSPIFYTGFRSGMLAGLDAPVSEQDYLSGIAAGEKIRDDGQAENIYAWLTR